MIGQLLYDYYQVNALIKATNDAHATEMRHAKLMAEWQDNQDRQARRAGSIDGESEVIEDHQRLISQAEIDATEKAWFERYV